MKFRCVCLRCGSQPAASKLRKYQTTYWVPVPAHLHRVTREFLATAAHAAVVYRIRADSPARRRHGAGEAQRYTRGRLPEALQPFYFIAANRNQQNTKE
ncbi:MAG: hypothetical protein JO319_09875 [Acidobacteriaceae bacterium]|nr:hypothetical protein [Acidobacteriaceae bacterium]